MVDAWYNSLPVRLNDFDPTAIRPYQDLQQNVPKKRSRNGDARSFDKPRLSGLYCLTNETENCHSFISYVHQAIHVDPADFQSLWEFGMDEDKVKPTKFMGSIVNRRQATFGAMYAFSGQKNNVFQIPESEYPHLVQLALEDARSRVDASDAAKLNGVHVNWYPGGKASVAAHADDEPQLVPFAPIFSYTFLESDNAMPRGFQILLQDGKTEIADIPLFNGDLLIMGGDMQMHFKHGIKKSAAEVFENHKRINITVRAFK